MINQRKIAGKFLIGQKKNLGGREKRFNIDVEVHEKMLKQFLNAIDHGNMEDRICGYSDAITLRLNFKTHSLFNDFTGFNMAALIVCTPMVTHAMTRAPNPAEIKYPQSKSTLKAKPSSQFFIIK